MHNNRSNLLEELESCIVVDFDLPREAKEQTKNWVDTICDLQSLDPTFQIEVLTKRDTTIVACASAMVIAYSS